ncbi:TPA: fimbrial protein [Klebsiella pneumoniae]|nr:fimbrial protein [Klebsiella pneumoniae]
MMVRSLQYSLLLFAGFFLFIINGAYCATKKTDSVHVSIRGVIVNKPSCTINDRETIEVNFGDNIGLNKINGDNFRQPIPYKIICDDHTDSLQLTLKYTGDVADFDADKATVRTFEQSNLGVKLYQNGMPFELGKSINININNIPTLEAVLVRRDGASLLEGEFNAIATLHAEYQ